jgi:hypothetical protein
MKAGIPKLDTKKEDKARVYKSCELGGVSNVTQTTFLPPASIKVWSAGTQNCTQN